MIKNDLSVVPYDASLRKLAFKFDSGNNYLDEFLRSSSALDDGIGKTYVFLDDIGSTIIGYYNIGMGYVEQVNSNMKRYKIGGSVHVNCFALDKKYHRLPQGKAYDGRNVYLSDLLLHDCIKKAMYIRKNYIGFSFVTLCSTNQGHGLYERNNFFDLEEDMNFSIDETDDDCKLMYFPIDFE